jgi:PKD repeat protein
VSASSPVTTHSYSAKGTYSVALVVLDDGGLSSTIKKSVTVKSVARR